MKQPTNVMVLVGFLFSLVFFCFKLSLSVHNCLMFLEEITETDHYNVSEKPAYSSGLPVHA